MYRGQAGGRARVPATANAIVGSKTLHWEKFVLRKMRLMKEEPLPGQLAFFLLQTSIPC